MNRYRIITPVTPHAPCTFCADFEAGHDCERLETVATVLRMHAFDGCAVYRRERGHWSIIFDTTARNDARLPGSLYWINVQQNEMRSA